MLKRLLSVFCATLCACAPLDAEMVFKIATVQSYEDLDSLIEAGGYLESGFEPRHIRFKKDCPLIDEEASGSPSGEMEFLLVTFSRSLATEEALLYFRQNGLRPATTRELLLFGTAFQDDPELHQKIVVLGEECRGESYHITRWGKSYPYARIARYNKRYREIGIIFAHEYEYGEYWWILTEGHEHMFLAFKND